MFLKNQQPELVDPQGKPVQSDKYTPCPRCGRSADKRVPSAGFGTDIYMICPCGYEFKHLRYEQPIL